MSSSSTSNFEAMAAVGHRVPPTARKLTLVLACLLGLALTAGWELYLRAAGHAPPQSGTDDVAATAAGKLRQTSWPDVLIVGSSRTRIGVDPESVSASLDGASTQTLTLPATNSLQLLRLVMKQDDLPPVIVIEVLPAQFYRDRDSASALATRDYLARPAWYTIPEQKYAGFKRQLVLSGSRSSPLDVARDTMRSQLGMQSTVLIEPVYFERSSGWLELLPTPAYLDFARVDVEHATRVLRLREAEITDAEVAALLEKLREFDAELKQRGCTLLVYQPPSGPPYSIAEEEKFPRARTWDAVAKALPGRALHYQDHPETTTYKMPDGSHLVSPDAKHFSQELGKWIREATQK